MKVEFLARAVVFSVVGLFALGSHSIADPDAVTPNVNQDGLVADLRIIDDKAVVRWRFLKPLQSPLKEIRAQLDGQPLGTPAVAEFPLPGEETRLLAMIDVTGKERQADIIKHIAAALAVATTAPRHVQVAFATYASRLNILTPRNIDELVTKLVGMSPEDTEPDLAQSLAAGLDAVAALPAQRRALFVYSDGHAGTSIKNDFAAVSASSGECQNCASRLAEWAVQNGVAVTFVLSDGTRTVDRPMLNGIAERTGGQVVIEPELPVFLRNPYTVIDSGGTAVFPVDARSRYFWEAMPRLTVDFLYGDKKIQLSTISSLPTADALQTANYLWERYQIPILAGAIVLGGFIILLAVLLIRRSKRKGSAVQPKRWPVLAVLQDTTNGTVYPIKVSPASIGRADDNDIVLDDSTVSRLHAVLEHISNGSFSIHNKSDVNGALVNGQAINECTLSDGDVISLGDKKLRFAHVPNW